MKRLLWTCLVATAALCSAAPAYAGAPNYTCRFGDVRLAGDVHRNVGLVQETPSRAVRVLEVVDDGSGGSGFTARRGRDRYVVRLLGAGDGRLLLGAPSTLALTTPGGRRVQRGACSAVTGDHRLGRLVAAAGAVRTAPQSAAPRVRGPTSLPLLWARVGAPRPVPVGWVAVTLWAADGSRRFGFAPQAAVRFP